MILISIIILLFTISESMVYLAPMTEQKSDNILVRYYYDFSVLKIHKRFHIHFNLIESKCSVLQIEYETDVYVICICNIAFVFKRNK